MAGFLLDLACRIPNFSVIMDQENQTSPPVETPVVAETPAAPVVIAPIVSGTDAQIGARVGAYLIDVVIAIVAGIVVGVVSSKLGNLVTLAYLLTRDALPFLDGQSLGKKVMKIRAVTEDGKSLSGNWNPGLIRNAVMLIPFFPLVELIIVLTSKGKPNENRRLGDQWAKTKVINAA